MRKTNLLFCFLCTLFISTCISAKFLPPSQGKHGMVVTSQFLASEVGAQILREGGNAVDAAVAVGYALSVVHPCCGAIGGGGFMLVHLNTNKNIFINFREMAPHRIVPSLYIDKDGKIDQKKLRHSYLSVGVPGTVMGLNTALSRYGTMPLKHVIAPAIKLALNGYRLTRTGAALIARHASFFRSQLNVAQIFLPGGKVPQAGTLIRQPELAHTLELIANRGSDAFYRGPIARKIVAASDAHGGILSLTDFSNYHITITRPISCKYRGYKIITSPPPSSGAVICEMLNVLSAYPLTKQGFHSAQATHENVEAMRYAFADRNYYFGDPRFATIPLQKILSLKYADSIRQKIKPNKAGNSKSIVKALSNNKEKMETTHYSIVDGKGDAVAVTYTLNGNFGNKIIAPGTGFFLNNELDDFTIKPNEPNQFGLIQGNNNLIAPRKIPLSSMSPTIVMKNNTVYMVLGAAGGPTILTTILHIIENVIDFHMDINTAVNQPRYHMQLFPDTVFMEPRTFSADTLQLLKKMGYRFQIGFYKKHLYWGQAAAILKDPKTHILYGANDNRRPQGRAIGV